MLAPDEVAHLKRRLAEGASRLGAPVSENQCDTLIRFIALLTKWNRVYNLTAIRDPRQMQGDHLPRIADGSKVIDSVPLGKQRDEPNQRIALVFGDGRTKP